TAIKSPNNMAKIDSVRLAQLAVFKFLILTVNGEILSLEQKLKTSINSQAQSTNKFEATENLVAVAKNKGSIAYRVLHRLFTQIERIESGRMRSLRKTLITNASGVSWPIPREALFNPLLQLSNILGEDMAMYSYSILFMYNDIYTDGISNIININRCIVEVFRDFLPAWVQPEPESKKILNRLDKGNLPGFVKTEIILNKFMTEEEYKQPYNTQEPVYRASSGSYCSWLDDPNNLVRLLSLTAATDQFGNRPGIEMKDNDTAERWRLFMRNMREDLVQRVINLDISQDIVASYLTPGVCRNLPSNTSPWMVYRYLTGKEERQKIINSIVSNCLPQPTPASVTKILDAAVIETKKVSKEGVRRYIGKMLIDFLILRRDLKLAYKTFEAMDQVSIHLDAKQQSLSRANGQLCTFILRDETPQDTRIVSHVILKADLRGSTKVTKELRERNLNPATHFSENFFDPITDAIQSFNANKVFVEGDAIILSILEKSNSPGDTIVAWACGMGMDILDIVASNNSVSARYNLPLLELGLGIAFINEEPTFLHDGDRQIMISSAINLADRLSSCAKGLRDAAFAKNRPFRVEVLLPPAGSDATAGAKTDVLRYNVNGIEMDEAAFNKLQTEINLRPLYFKLGGKVEKIYGGRYPDCKGNLRWLVIRESPMHNWIDGGISKHPAPEKRFFYEVIVDKALIDKVRAKFSSGKSERDPRDSEISNLE
ncbi:hypothetical protein TI04_09970, partial [Achromatium sp. WMS2]